MEEEASECLFQKLPDEVLLKILTARNINSRTVMNFGQTCKQFSELVKDSLLWKKRLHNTWPEIYAAVLRYESDKWQEHYQYVHTLEIRVTSQLKLLSPTYFWKEKEFSFDDAEPFFMMCKEKRVSLLCVHHILAKVYANSGQVIKSDRPSKSLNTLTIQYYSGRVLRFLMHLFQMICWQDMRVKQKYMSPEIVLNFYINWINTFEYYNYEIEKDLLEELAKEVWKELPQNHALHNVQEDVRSAWIKRPLIDNLWSAQGNLAVHAAVRRVLYDKRGLSLSPRPTLHSLHLANVIKSKRGFMVAVGVLYEALTRRCGVKCAIIAFPNHFFLDWRESYTQTSPSYRIDLTNGQLVKKRTCPFQNGESVVSREYHPQTLLLSLTEAMQKSADDERNFSMHLKVESLIEFLQIMDHDGETTFGYKRYLEFLEVIRINRLLLETRAPNFYNLDKKHCNLMLAINSISGDGKVDHASAHLRTVYRNHTTTTVRFAVGMVCLHRMYGYKCVILGWDVQCTATAEWQERMGVHNLSYKHSQPFYTVLAKDGTSRYVAQENLQLVVGERLTVIEDLIGKEFSHFTGSYYVPNQEKSREYPDDKMIVAAYRRQPTLLMRTLVKYNHPRSGSMHLYNLC